MKNSNFYDKVTIISTKAKDRQLNEKKQCVATQEGGPLLFLQNALKQSDIPYLSFSGKKITVDILITEKGEFGRIEKEPERQLFPIDKVSEWVIVSTILNEWDLKPISNNTYKIFVDVQGYVRNGKNFS